MSRNCVPKSCKMSEINESEIQTPNSKLPLGWRWVRLGEVLKEPLRNGLNYRKEDFGFGTKFVNVSDIFCPAVIDTTKLERINLTLKDVEKYKLEAGDILVVRSSLKREGVAYPALFIEDEEPVVFCGFLIRVRPDEKKIEPFYLLNYLRSSIARETLVGDSDTVTITNVDQGTLLSLSIPLSPLEEQRRIATKIQELMRDVAHARTACEEQLEAAKALPATYLREVFESEDAKEWERKRLGEVCDIVTGSTPRTDDPTNWNGDILWATPNDMGKLIGSIIDDTERKISERGFKSCSTTLLPPGSVLLTTRAPIGHLAINTKPICTNQGFKSFIPSSQLYDWFLFFALKYFVPVLQSMGRGQTFTEISKRQVESFEIPLPPLPAQHHIASELKEKVAKIENLQSAIRNQQSALNALPQAILAKAFRGEL